MAINRPTSGTIAERVIAARYEGNSHRRDSIGIGGFQPEDENNQDAKGEYQNSVKDKARRARETNEVNRSELAKTSEKRLVGR